MARGQGTSTATRMLAVAQEHDRRLDRGRAPIRLREGRSRLHWVAKRQRRAPDRRSASRSARFEHVRHVRGSKGASRTRAIHARAVQRRRQPPARVEPPGTLGRRRRLGTKELMLEIAPDSATEGPRLTAIGWSPDSRYVYLTSASRTAWERGVSRFDRTAKRLEELVKDGRALLELPALEGRLGRVLSVADGNRPPDIYVGDALLRGLRRLTDGNPWLAIARSEAPSCCRISTPTATGSSASSTIRPATTKGQRYPTVFNIYEDFFDDTFDATANVLTAHGYVVVKPSVDFDIGYPGEAWVKGVTSAANKLIEMGVADSARLGVHGTSYGGYATNLLITQTNRFKAAINISGKVDIISFYTDSPRLGVRNVHAAEKSQDRTRRDAVAAAAEVRRSTRRSCSPIASTTPLLLMTGEQDSNVPANNTREMYYALRRLGKTVEWVNYMNSGHGTPGTTVEDFTDFHRRMLAWYDKYLKADPAKKVAAQD